MRLPVLSAILLFAASSSALAKECRTPDLSPGVKVRLPPGCDDPIRTGRFEAEKQKSLKADQGFIDLGNGTQVRIGGRVRAETGFRR